MKETQNSVAQWGRDTFGLTPVLRIATRMNIEMAELLLALADYNGLSADDPLRLSLDRNLAQARQIAQLTGRTEGLVDPAQFYNGAAALECADVLVMLLQVADALDSDLWAQMEHKMSVNRGRKWAKDEHGLSQHVSEPA